MSRLALIFQFCWPNVCAWTSGGRDWDGWLLWEESIAAGEKYERSSGEGSNGTKMINIKYQWSIHGNHSKTGKLKII